MSDISAQPYLVELSAFSSGDSARDSDLKAKAERAAKEFGAPPGEPLRLLDLGDSVHVIFTAPDGRPLGVCLTSDDECGLAG